MAQGIYKILPLDENSGFLGNPNPPAGHPYEPPNPADDRAVEIYCGLMSDAPQPYPKEQLDLQLEIAKVFRTIELLYRCPKSINDNRNKIQFREYYIRLFRLAQLGLEGPNASPEVAMIELGVVKENLIDDEAGRIKNGYLKTLALNALSLSFVSMCGYLYLRVLPKNQNDFLRKLYIEPEILSNFILLWIGCFLGVWLSYGIRTTNFTLKDLTLINSDRLEPIIRLIFAGSLTMLLGIIINFGLVDIKLGNYSLTNFSTTPMLAFLLGAFCGISELLLPTAISKRSSDFINNVK